MFARMRCCREASNGNETAQENIICRSCRRRGQVGRKWFSILERAPQRNIVQGAVGLLDIGVKRDAVAEEDVEHELVDPSQGCEDDRRELSLRCRLNSSSDARVENI